MVQVSLTGPKTPASKLLSENMEADQNIAVFVRCRPMKVGDKKNVVEVIPDQKSIRVNDRGNPSSVLGNDKLYSRVFSFDSVFGPNTEQIEVYRSVVSPLIEQVIAGYNCTVFAYGQTGTGKTYTMEGERTGDDFTWEEDPLSGIIPRALHQLFETLPENTEHTIGVSFIELYNEELFDLLSPVDDTSKLKIYDDPVKKGSVIISGLEEINVHTKAQIYEILRKGSEKRQTAATLLNACSSRSHTIFSVTVHIKENSIDGEELLKIGKLNLVDLAGSENIGRSGACEKRAREAGNINQSLLTLGRVITSLVEKAPHIPYRESKLTRLLKDSLGGRTKTSIIATISPNVLDADDTLSTLEYAQRAKKITNKPEVNQKLSKKTLLKEYTAEIERLRRDLLACREKNGFYISEANYNELLEKNDSQAKEIHQREAELAALQEDLERITALFGETKEELEEKEAKLVETTESLKVTEETLKQTEENLVEQTYLLDVHSKNEKMLYSQARELLMFADNSSKDLLNLHRKVDCQKNLEDTNFSKINIFQQNFNAQMDHFLHLLDVGTDSLSECLSTIKPEINNGFTLLTKNITEIVHNITTTSNCVENFESDFEAVLQSDKFSSEKVSSNKEMISYLNESRLLYEQKLHEEIASTRNVFEKGLRQVSEVINLQRNEVENLLMKQSEHMNQFTTFRTNCIQNIRALVNSYFDAHNAEILGLKSEIEALKSSQNEYNSAKASKMNQIGQLLVELSEYEKASVAATGKNIDAVVSVVDNMLKETETEKNKIFKVVNETSENLAMKEKVLVEYIDNVDGLNCRNIQANICEIDYINTDAKPRFEKIEKIMVDMSEDLKCNIDENIKMCDEIIEAMDCNLDQKQQIVSEMKKEVMQSNSSSKSATESTLSNIAKTQENVLRRVSMATKEAINWSRSYKRELKTRSSDFDIFKSSELAKYVPTGTTPQKNELNYPQRLVVTSPNEELLSRFRKLINEKKAAEVPLPDSDDLEITLQSNNSSDSTNVENKSPLIIDPLNTSKEKNKKANGCVEGKRVKEKEKANVSRMKPKPFNEVNQ